MLTEIDYDMYFSAILNAEKMMTSQLDQLLLLTSDPDITEVLREIRNDEIKHSGLVRKLFRILETETVSKS
jgi:rubrerythrin